MLLVNGEDYSATNETSVSLLDPADLADQIVINSFSTFFTSLAKNYVYSGETYFKSYSYTADSGQTVFSGSDADGNILSFDSDNYQVYINGFRIGDVDFTANPINDTITLSPAALLNDEIVVTVVENRALGAEVNDLIISSVDSYANLVFDSDYVQSKLTFNIAQSTIDFYRFVATSTQTNFTGTDAFGNTLSYRPNNASVYYNGSLLTNTLDYTATNGTSIQLTLAADSGDEISVVNYNQSFIAEVDSSVVTSIVDSDYINSRVVIPPSYGDSNVILLVDSDYINARVVIPGAGIEGIDSSVVTSIVDSDYINARVVIPPSYGDSDVILLVDSDYIQQRQLSGGGGGFVSTYTYDGQLNTSTGSVREYIHTLSTLGYADLYLSVASSGAGVIISINKNGTSITTLTLPAGQTSSLNNTINESFIQGDYITVDINQIGTTAPGEDLVVNLVFS